MDANIYRGIMILLKYGNQNELLVKQQSHCLPGALTYCEQEPLDKILNMTPAKLFETNLIGEAVYLCWVLLDREDPPLGKCQFYVSECLDKLREWIGI